LSINHSTLNESSEDNRWAHSLAHFELKSLFKKLFLFPSAVALAKSQQMAESIVLSPHLLPSGRTVVLSVLTDIMVGYIGIFHNNIFHHSSSARTEKDLLLYYLLTLCKATDAELLELTGVALPMSIDGLKSEHSHSVKSTAPPARNNSRKKNTKNSNNNNNNNNNENQPNPSTKTKKNRTRSTGLKELPKTFHNVIESMNSGEMEIVDINIDVEEEAERQAQHESYLKELFANLNKKSYLSANSLGKLNKSFVKYI
jgi:hypothetical protein